MGNLTSRVKNILVVLAVPVIFLVAGIATLSDYGMNWDEPFHFMRGQAYLNFLLTGEKDYSSLPAYPRLSKDCPEWAQGNCDVSPGGATDILYSKDKGVLYEKAIKSLYPRGRFKAWRSFFQHDTYSFNSIVANESGHPPLNGILSALSNYVFFQKFHLSGDIEAHHLFEIFASFLIVLGVSLFVYSKLGLFPSVVASFSLAAYPLFFSESHFNIKDPPETAFFGLTIITFYFGITKNKWKFILLSAIFAAFALGTKFNALFIAPIIFVWLLYYLVFLFRKTKKRMLTKNWIKRVRPTVVALFFYPVVTLGIFYIFWPYLWSDPINNLATIVNYYRQIGLGTPPGLSRYLINGWNTYPIVWIIYTTPIPILLLTIVGLIGSIYRSLFKKDHFTLLVLVWFLLPIFRVSYPGTIIYGGVRQIMEFLPAMAILAGIGAWILLEMARKLFHRNSVLTNAIKLTIIILFVFVFYEMVKIHPNENVYFNQLIGGLSGAKDRNIPNWGSSYGNVYYQGTKWLNENAEPNARLALPIGTMGNISKLSLRSDIIFFNGYWSGPDKGGEYLMEMDFDWLPKQWYSYAYYDTFLEPVYEVKVDGVSLLKVWKNDAEHIKKGFESERGYKILSTKLSENQLTIDLGQDIYLTRLNIYHSTYGCQELQPESYLAISSDGEEWHREPEPLGKPQFPLEALGRVSSDLVSDEDTLVYLFAAKKARYILVDSQADNACILKKPRIEVRGLMDTPAN